MAKEKPPIFGMIQRGGEVVLQILSNVKQATIAPLIQSVIAPNTLIYTDEYSIYARLAEWGYEPSRSITDKKNMPETRIGDGFCEVHVNTSGRLLVIVTFLAKTTSWDFPRQTASLFRIL